MKRIRLAVVDDSSFVRKALARMMEDHPQVTVVGSAACGEELLDNLERWRPDVVTLDLTMPGLGGLATLDRIMARHPLPVIILSTHSAQDAPLTIEALHRGAVDFVDKQRYSMLDFKGLRTALVEKIVQVASRCSEQAPPRRDRSGAQEKAPASEWARGGEGPFSVLLIGASTGGPPAIQRVLQDLGPSLPVPAAVVQHMSAGFTKAFADRLDAQLPFPVREAVHGHPFERGTVHIAPSGTHLRLGREGARVITLLTDQPEGVPHRPSVDVLFDSGAVVYGPFSLAVLLTGMGKDGARGLARLAFQGAHTLSQDESSCVVYGMPKAAAEIGAVKEELPLEAIGPRVADLLTRADTAGH